MGLCFFTVSVERIISPRRGNYIAHDERYMIKEYIIEKIFTENGIKFLRDDMSICVDDLNKKILSDASEEVVFFQKIN